MRSVELARPAGTPLSVEVTSAGGRRPVVLLCGAPRELADRSVETIVQWLARQLV